MIARALLAALLLCWPFAAAADVAVPPLSGRVVDQTGTLSASDAAALTQRLKDLETRKGSQVAVLIVPTTQPETIEQFSIRVAEAWKIGRKKIDDGGFETPYRLRKQVVEPVFGQIKQARGFRQFLLRGVEKVRAEWAMICTTHNLLKLFAFAKAA